MNYPLPVPEYESCYVVFLDILGFKEKVMESLNDDRVLGFLHDSMRICASIPSGGKKISTTDGGEQTLDIQSRFFSDTLVFFIKENPEDLPQLLFIVRYIQDQLWERGICLRGSITTGGMYWPDKEQNITLGPGLIAAYELEKDVANFPRIVMSSNLYGSLAGITAHPFGEDDSMVRDYVRRDFDGVYFLDLLNVGITRKESEELLANTDHFFVGWNPKNDSNWSLVNSYVQRVITENLIGDVSDRIRQKYDWLQSYLDGARNAATQ